MENLQGIKQAKVTTQKTLSGPVTWILLVIFVLSILGFGMILASDSPSVALRRFFNYCFDSKYDKAWQMVKLGSDYSQQYSDDIKKFEDMWTRTKTHGTTYLKIRIDSAKFDVKSTSDRQVAIVAYSVMTREQVKDDKTGKISNQLNDSNYGYITMEKLRGEGWKLIRPSK
jgi:hypothetical protein